MLKKCTFSILFTMLAMAGVANAAYNGTPTAKENFAKETINNKNCYKISSPEDLYGFAAIVNGTNGNTAEPAACGVLTQNITVNENVLTSAGELNTAPAGGFIEWTPIGKPTGFSNAFRGMFYGRGYTISGLYFNNSETDYVGLFAYTSGKLTIDGVGVVDSYFRGKDYVGGLVGYHNNQSSQKLSVNNSYNTGSVNGANYVGGLVGYGAAIVSVNNSYNTGFVNGSSNVGGLVGVNGDIYFSYNTGSVTGIDNVGGLEGLAGRNQIIDCYNTGSVKEGNGVGNALLGEGCEDVNTNMNNSYYLEGSGNSCGPSSFSGTADEFANGYVALELHNNTAAGAGVGASIWGQIVGADKTPLLTGEIKFLLNDGCFEIANEEDLYLFAAAVNNGVDSKVCAKLTADITVNENVLGTGNANIDATTGAYTGSTTGLREWTPIGNSDHPFIGTFDGDGHTISGLYFNDDAKKYVGLFGYVESSESVDVSIKNVGLEDSYFKANGKVGGVVGLVGDNVDVKIENVYNAAVVADGGSSGYVGGIVGEFWTYAPSTLNIFNSYNSGAVFGNNSVGGLVGGVDGEDVVSSVSVKNCYNYGALSAFDNQGETLIGSVVGSKVSVNISDTYYLENSNLKSSHGGTEMSSTQFSDGTVLTALSNAEGGEVWRQYSGDAYPTFVKKSGTTFEPNAEGYYEIATADDLYKFAEIVNNGTAVGSGTELDVKAKLIADICVNACGEGESVLKDDGTLNGDGSSFTPWTPIGIAGYPFIGTFDGQGHTISGLYFNDANEINVGLFGDVTGDGETVSISNIGIEDSYFKAGSGVGGVVGYAEFVALDMKNVFNAAVVEGYSYVGGVVGFVSLNENQTSIMVNVYNVGSINGMDADAGQAGGLVGDFMNDYETSMLTIKNSYNYGDVAGGNPLVGKVENEYENVSVTNSFYKGSSISGDYGEFKSATDFSNGTVYVALHSAEGGEDWLQYAGDDYPTLVAKTGTGAPAPMHVAVLHYFETDSVVIAYTEGSAFTLPAEDNSGNPIAGWTTSADGSGNAITEIPTSATTDLKLYPKIKTFEPNAEGYYEIATAEDLYKFAEIVNNGTVQDAKAKLTADIVVNKHVLADANGVSKVNSDGAYIGADSASFHKWIPIGSSNGNPFKGSFDGQGHVISGLYINEPVLQGYNYNALFGAVGGESVTIKNVGVEDSYFSGQRYVSGLVGGSFSDTLKIENSYSAATLHGINGLGGLVGEVSNGKYKLSIENSYSFGTIKYDTSSGGLPAVTGALVGGGAKITEVHNSYYLVQEGVESKYGSAASSVAFANGTVATLLHGEGVSADSLWGQNVSGGDSHPNFYKGVNVENGPGVITGGPATSMVVLHFLDGSDTSFTYVEGWGKSLPEKDKDGKYVIWYDEGGTSYIDIPSTVNGDLNLHAVEFKPGSDGVYEIVDVTTLYKFAAIVNGGNATAKAKLKNDIVVNENVLATAGGVSNVDATTGNYIGSTTGLREWTPIGYCTGTWDCPAKFQGSFDGQGHTISGLYYNDKNSFDAGLFGYIGGTQSEVSIQNVGVVDSYFKAGQFAGGILGRADENTDVKVENVSNASVAVAPAAGGIVGRIYGKDFDMTNAYNVGSAFGTNAGGLVGEIYSDKSTIINNSYSYGPFKDGAGALIGSVSGGPSPTVTNSFYLASEQVGDYGTNKSAADFENGTVLAALRSGEGGYVWVQTEGDKYPTIDINASKNANTIVLDWTNAADSTALKDVGYTDGAMVIVKDGKKFYANGAIYEGILSADQVAAIGDDMLHPVSGIELATVNDKLVATVNADSDEPLMIPTDVEVSEVVYERVLTKGVYATIMVPFSVPVSSVSGFSFYKFKRVGQTNEGKWAVYVSTVKDSLRANTPYIIVASNNATQITFKLDNYLTLNTTSDVYETTNGNWTMKGVYERKDFLKGDPELGKAYGFAGDTTQVNTRIGRFVRAGDGSYVLPMGVYLVYEEPKMLARPGQMGSSFARINVMPENISVEIEDEEETTVVKHITVAPTFVKSSDRWFDMKGRSLGEKPTAKGTYYHNGQRVIIK